MPVVAVHVHVVSVLVVADTVVGIADRTGCHVVVAAVVAVVAVVETVDYGA